MRRGRNARVGALPQLPVLPAGTVRAAVCDGLDRSGVAGRSDAFAPRHGRRARRADRPAVGRAEEARRARRAARARVGCAHPRRADQPPRPRRHRLPRGMARRLPGRPAPRDPRPSRARPRHEQGARDRPRRDATSTFRTNGPADPDTRRTSRRASNAKRRPRRRSKLARTSRAASSRGCGGARRRARRSRRRASIPPTRSSRAVPRRPHARASSACRSGSTRLGSKGVELHGVGFSWPTARDGGDAGPLLVLKPFDYMLEPGDRVGIVGPNGAGKSTLLDLIAGRLQPTQGRVEIGRTVKIGYYDQLGRDLDLTQRVRDAVAGDKGEPTLDDVKLMRQFWFDGDAQFAPISTLSGGERRRLQLLLTLIEQPNVLLARRADERSRPRHAARARGVPRRLAGHRRRRQPRPRLPRSHGQRGDGTRRQRSSRAWCAAASPDGSRNTRRGRPVRPARRPPPARNGRDTAGGEARVDEEPEHAAPSARASPIASSPTRSRRETRCRPSSSPRAPTTRSWRASARSWPPVRAASTPPKSAGSHWPTRPNHSAWRSEARIYVMHDRSSHVTPTMPARVSPRSSGDRATAS